MLNLTNALFTLDGRTLTNPAGQTATWTGFNNQIELSDGDVFDNQGVFQDQCTAGHDFENAARWQRQGPSTMTEAFIKSASSSQGSFLQGVSFNVTSGSVDVQTGTLELLGGGTDTGATFTSAKRVPRSIFGRVAHTGCRAADVGVSGNVRSSGSRAPSPWLELMM